MSEKSTQQWAKWGAYPRLLGSDKDESARFQIVATTKTGHGTTGSFVVIDREDPVEAGGLRSKRYNATVMQIPKMTHRDLRSTMSEIRCMSLLSHSCIVRFVADYLHEDRLVIVMEHCELGDIEQQIKLRASRNFDYFKENEAFLMTLQLCLALDHVHTKRMLHRNLKTANVYLDNKGLVKLGGFGHANTYSETVSNVVAGTFVGTPVYLAPELWQRRRYSSKADIWALGVIMFELLSLKRPYYSHCYKDLMAKILCEVHTPPPPHYSDGVIEVCNSLLSKDPAMRPSMKRLFSQERVTQGLRELSSVIRRQRTLEQPHKNCLLDHIEQVLGPEVEGGSAATGEWCGHLEQLVCDEDDVQKKSWRRVFVSADPKGVLVFHRKGDEEPITKISVDEVSNACPIGPQQTGMPDAIVWGLIKVDDSAEWFKCESQQQLHGWLDHFLRQDDAQG